MGVAVFVADEQHDHPVDAIRWLRLAEQVLAAEGVRGNAELSVLFVDEQGITDLNKRFSSIDGPTDVLAFPIDEEPAEGGRSPDSGGSGPGYTPSEPADLPTLLGDVVICPHVASRNAPDHAGTYDDEIALLLVHGILHLMGMDHHDDDEAELMEARERELLVRFHRPPDASTGVSPTPSPAGTPAGTSAPSTAERAVKGPPARASAPAAPAPVAPGPEGVPPPLGPGPGVEPAPGAAT